jgi:hypothetical protein
MAASENDREFYARKGRDYFEKIIQLGVPVPDPTPRQIHGLISAMFPAWASASDLIGAALGNNPRRVKQYAALLDYRYAVSRLGLPPEWFAGNREVFDKLVALNWRDETVALQLRAAEAKFGSNGLEILETAIEKQSPGPDLEAMKELIAVYGQAVQKPLLQDALLTAPRLSTADAAVRRTLFEFCDYSRDDRQLVVSKDPAFARLLAQLLTGRLLSEDSLLAEDLDV